jgi:small-conductance mechanosensitive channel
VLRLVHVAPFGTDHAATTLTGSCGSSPGVACRVIWDLTHNGQVASLTTNFLAGPVHLVLRIVYVLALAFLIRAVLHRVINRITERATDTILPQFRGGVASSLVASRLRPLRRRRAEDATADAADSAGPVEGADGAGAAASAAEPASAAASSAADVADAADAADDIGSAAPGGASVTGPAAEAMGIRAVRAADGGATDAVGGRPADAVGDGAADAVGEKAADAVGDGAAEAIGGASGSAIADASAPEIAAAAANAERALVAERRHQRVRALGSILRSTASATVFGIAGVVVLGDLGINLAPLLASAGVVGFAIGFGAQNLVRDYLSGIFMLLEDQYGVGDVITVGDATGTVETVTLRITRLRDVNGIVWHVRNGTIEQVGNESQGWARAVIDFPVPYAADLATIRTVLSDTALTLWNEPTWRAVMLEEPEVWGAQEVSSSEVTMRIVVKTAPLRQWEVEREMRARVKAALDAAGITPVIEDASTA